MGKNIPLGVLGLKKLLTLSPDERLAALERDKAAGVISPEGYAKGVAAAEEFRKELNQTAIPQTGPATGRMGPYPQTFGTRGVVDTLFGGATSNAPTVAPTVKTSTVSPVGQSGEQTTEKPSIPQTAREIIKQHTVKTDQPMEFQSGPEAEKRRWEQLPLHERYASPREALNNMSDAEYKIFADEHKHVPGLGYVIDEKSGKLQRIIPASVREKKLPNMSPIQMRAYTGMISSINQGRSAAASEARLGVEGRRADITEKRYEDMTNLEREKFAFEVDKFNQVSNLKDPMNFVKAVEMFSPDEVDEYGTKTGKKNYRAGGEALLAMGYPAPKGMKIPDAVKSPPPVGTVVKSYRFKGGNPADQKNWEKI